MAEQGGHLEKTHFPYFPGSPWSDLAAIFFQDSWKAPSPHTITILRNHAISRYRGRSRYAWYCAIWPKI